MWYAGFNVILTNKLIYSVTSSKLKDVVYFKKIKKAPTFAEYHIIIKVVIRLEGKRNPLNFDTTVSK